MGIGSICTGMGGLDVAAEKYFGCESLWQVDYDPDDPKYGEYTASMRYRHFGTPIQISRDLRELDPRKLPVVEVFIGGFPCQDLSIAGKRAGLGGRKSSLYEYVMSWVGVMHPEYVLIENVPALLDYRETVDRELLALGYGVTWVKIAAAHAGAQHLRRRMFIVARRGETGSRLLDAGKLPKIARWGTPAARNWKDVGPNVNYERIAGKSGLAGQIAFKAATGTKMNPDWTDLLQGFPAGWTCRNGPPMWPDDDAPAVAPIVPDVFGASPQHDWEPPRTVPHETDIPDRDRRIKAVGNAVYWPQALMAIRMALGDELSPAASGWTGYPHEACGGYDIGPAQMRMFVGVA